MANNNEIQQLTVEIEKAEKILEDIRAEIKKLYAKKRNASQEKYLKQLLEDDKYYKNRAEQLHQKRRELRRQTGKLSILNSIIEYLDR